MIQRILVPTDFSEPADLALRHARELARLFGAELQLLSSVYVSLVWGHEPPVPIAADFLEAVRERAQQDLEERARALRASGIQVGCHVSFEHAPSAICTLAASWPADLIAMGTHGRSGIPHALLGSVAARSVRLAVCPVLTVRSGAAEPRPIRSILVATDFSADARSALDWAGGLADRSGARVSLVHALPRTAGRAEEIRERLERIREEFSDAIGEVVTEPGHADEVALRTAKRLDSDLIVVGTRGLSGLEHVLLGSNAERIVRRAPVPVVVVKSP